MACAGLDPPRWICATPQPAVWTAWDVAAAALILEEAGGVVTDFDGGPDYMKPPYALVASTPALHPLMLEKLHPRR